MEEEQRIPGLGEDHPPVPNAEGDNLFQNLLAAANMSLPNTAEVMEDSPPENMEQPLHHNDKTEEGQSPTNDVTREDLQLPSESIGSDGNAVGESEQQHYLFTKSPSSGTGESNYEDDDEEEEESPEFQAPTSGSAMEVESSNGTREQNAEMNSESQDASRQDNSGGPQQESYGNEQYDPYEESYADEEYDKLESWEDAAGIVQPFKIFVSNLPPGFPNSELQELFEKYGKVDECEIFAKNYAFVHMESPESGLQAMNELHGLDIRGCKINVKRSVQTRDTSSNSLLTTNAVNEELEVGTYKIFIAGLFEDVTKEYVERLLEENECGRAVEIEIFRNNSAFVHMETEEGGKMAIEKLNGKVIPESECDKPLRVTVSKNPRGPSLPIMKLKVKNVSTSMSASELRSLFFPYGLVLGVQIIPKIYSGRTRHAIVLLEQYSNIRSAIKELSGKEVHGFKLSVEACFDDMKSTTSQPKQNRSNPFNQDDSEWQEVHNPPIPPHPPRRFAPAPRMRLIPMPSQADFQRFPRGNRGRPLLGHAPPPPIMHQHFRPPPRPMFQPPTGYNDDYNEVLNAGFGGGYSNYESESFNNGYGFNNETNESDRYIPAMKRFRDWNNSEGSNNFEKQKPIKNRPTIPRDSSTHQNPFPHFPTPGEFPKPPKLMSIQPQQFATNECDWSDDLQLSSLSDNFLTGTPVGHQDFASDETSTATTHAVPFDYSQVNKRKHMKLIPMPSQADFQNQKRFLNQKGKNSKNAKKGKPRRPGLGSAQQQKVFANQAGADDVSQDAVNQPAVAANTGANSVENQAAASSTPSYFQQNWTFKSKRPTGKPSVKQIKEAEEEQKRQYADYLKQKPWLYQAIPGTVKRVDK